MNFISNYCIKKVSNISDGTIKDVEEFYNANTFSQYCKSGFKLIKHNGLFSWLSFSIMQTFRIALIALALSYFTNMTFVNMLPIATVSAMIIWSIEVVFAWKMMVLSRKL